tara:strand:+ start:618 stop:1484 length:867 start_codon:yes stop_codon:yes gene_type:complete
MSNNPDKIRNLREKTGAGMMDCKNALEESNGDIEVAIQWLRKKGINTAEKKSSRDASDGLVTVMTRDNSGVIIEINSETDFVARNENFQEFCSQLSNLCLDKNISSIEELMNSKINDETRVEELLTNMISKLGENIVINRLSFLSETNSKYTSYIHNQVNSSSGKIGVLLVYKCSQVNDIVTKLAKNLSMHIAASNPMSLDVNDLDTNLVHREKEIYFEQLKESGKPNNIIEKIIEGKVNKFYEEVCLLQQYFVMENKLKVGNYIENFNKTNNLDFKVDKFLIFKLGQ